MALIKGEEPLAKVIEDGEKHCAYYHRHILLYSFSIEILFHPIHIDYLMV